MRPIESLPRRRWKMAIKRAALSPFIFFCNGPLLRLHPFVASSENLYSNLFLPLCLLVNAVTRYFFNCPTVLFYLFPPWAPVQAMTPPWFCFTVLLHISWRTSMKTGFLSTSLFHFYTFSLLFSSSSLFLNERPSSISNRNVLPFSFRCIN